MPIQETIKDNIAKRLLAADQYFRAGRYDEAKFELEHALHADPKNYYARSLMERISHIHRESEKKEEDKRTAETQAMENKVTKIAELLKNAQKFIAAKDFKNALAQVAKVYEVDPSNHFAHGYSDYIEKMMNKEAASTAKIPPVKTVPSAPPEKKIAPGTGQVTVDVGGKPYSAAATKDVESRLAIYKELLREMWFDGVLKDHEIAELKRVRDMFAISLKDHEELEREVKVDAYIEALRIAWRDGVITQSEQEVLEVMRENYGISMEEHLSAEARILWASKTPDAKGTLLIADDDQTILLSLAARLKKHGYTIITASSVEEALDKLQTVTPALILSDLMFEGSNLTGASFYAEVRKNPTFINIPFLLMSGISDEFVVRAGKRMGIDDFLTKPLNFELLLATIEGKIKTIRH